MRVKLVPRSQVEELSEMLAVQGRRLRELESKLQKEKQEKANLEIDFQHLLDQLRIIPNRTMMTEEQAVVCS
jgi:hypothetical protein